MKHDLIKKIDIMKTIEDKLIEYLDNIIVTDDHGEQWLSVEYNEMEEEIRKLFKDHETNIKQARTDKAIRH